MSNEITESEGYCNNSGLLSYFHIRTHKNKTQYYYIRRITHCFHGTCAVEMMVAGEPAVHLDALPAFCMDAIKIIFSVVIDNN